MKIQNVREIEPLPNHPTINGIGSFMGDLVFLELLPDKRANVVVGLTPTQDGSEPSPERRGPVQD